MELGDLGCKLAGRRSATFTNLAMSDKLGSIAGLMTYEGVTRPVERGVVSVAPEGAMLATVISTIGSLPLGWPCPNFSRC